MNKTKTAPGTLTPLEKAGAVSFRYIHDLSNDASALTAALMSIQSRVARRTAINPRELADVEGAAERLNNRLRALGEAARSQRKSPPPISSREIVSVVKAATAEKTGWSFDNHKIEDQPVVCDPRWLRFVVEELIAHIGAPEGGLGISIESLSGATGAPGLAADEIRNFLCVRLSYPAAEPALAAEQIRTSSRVGLIVCHELIRQMRGWIKSRAKDAQQQLNLYLPIES